MYKYLLLGLTQKIAKESITSDLHTANSHICGQFDRGEWAVENDSIVAGQVTGAWKVIMPAVSLTAQEYGR